MTVKKVDERVRNWTFVIYPESMPEDYIDILDSYFTPWIISPLHDKDLDPSGELKKPHYHVLLLHEGKKSFNQMKAITERLNAPIPQKVSNARGLVRYMVHMDNPDKHQYDKSEIKGYCGADPLEYLKPTSSNRYQMILEMKRFIKTYKVTEFMQLFDYASEERFDDWFPLLCDNSAYVINLAITSNRHSIQMDKDSNVVTNLMIDKETGEVV